MIRIICNELDLQFDQSVEFVTDRPNHDRKYLIDPTKSEKLLGFKPSIPLDSGIRNTVRWFVQNRGWWEDILTRTGDLQIHWQKMQEEHDRES